MTKEEVKERQRLLNSLGATLTVDGIRGPKTIAAEKKYLQPVVIAPEPKIDAKNYFGAPWVGSGIHLLGKVETDKALNDWYSPHWKKVGLPGYKGLAGNARAWCSLKIDKDFVDVGIKGTGSAGAYSWSNWGTKCPFWFGSVMDIKHKSGGRHVGVFLYWIDEHKGLCAILGGNQGNKFSIVSQTINKSADVLVKGPRWPSNWPDGQFVTKAQVLAKYPLLKVGGVAGSTR